MLEINNDIEFEQYYCGVVIAEDGSHANMEKEKVKKYIMMIEKCPIICNNLVVQMSLKEKDKKIDFNGLVSYNENRGYSIYGTIDEDKKIITYYISFDNNDIYEEFKVTYAEINKGKVK